MTDGDLRQHVEHALTWEPGVDAAGIGVSVHEGVVTLRGHVGSYAQKVTAERAALRVYGVRAVANDLSVRLAGGAAPTDTEIAQAAVAALEWSAMVPADRVRVTVVDGWLTLDGTLDHYHQCAAAERAVRHLTGVRGVSNCIVLQTPTTPARTSEVAARIEAAFKRAAALDARRISVAVHDGTVVLTGNVRSWGERREAVRAARAAPGVTRVDDWIAVSP